MSAKFHTFVNVSYPVRESLLPLKRRDLSNHGINFLDQILDVGIVVTMEAALEEGEEEKITRGKVRGVRDTFNVHSFLEVFCDSYRVCTCIVVVKQVRMVCSSLPKVRSPVADHQMQLSEGKHICFSIHCPSKHPMSVDQSMNVKKSNQHRLLAVPWSVDNLRMIHPFG